MARPPSPDIHTHFHRHHTPSCVVTYPCPILGWTCPCRGPGQTSSLWNKRAANVCRQGRQLEPAHAVCEYELAWGGGGHGRTKHKHSTGRVEQQRSLLGKTRNSPCTCSLVLLHLLKNVRPHKRVQRQLPTLHALAEISRSLTHIRGS